MNKQKFIELVDNPSGISAKDAGILKELAKNYPYSPLVHTMLAKALQSGEEAKAALATAAVYISDRAVLKAIMEDELRSPSVPAPDSRPAPTSVEQAIEEEAATAPPSAPEPVPEPEQEVEKKNDVWLELEENLRRLKEQRERFENPDQNSPDNNPMAPKPRVETPSPESTEHSDLQSTPSPSRLGTLPEPLQELLENTEEKEINDPKRIEQINLIDSFIRNSSSLSRKYRSADDHDEEEQNDLTSSYAYTPPDLATENLAQIMVRQGKIEKAIDIYEKLILKNPQKKAYFAACIEKLKTP